jgi:hypothetical protein
MRDQPNTVRFPCLVAARSMMRETIPTRPPLNAYRLLLISSDLIAAQAQLFWRAGLERIVVYSVLWDEPTIDRLRSRRKAALNR